MIGNEKAPSALVLLILATSFVWARHVFWVVTNLDFYASRVGAIWLAGMVPYFIVVTGCILYLLKRKFGLTFIVVRGLLLFFGSTWSYIPYLPALSANPVAKFLLMIGGNLTVLAILVWTARRQAIDQHASE